MLKSPFPEALTFGGVPLVAFESPSTAIGGRFSRARTL